MLPILAEMGLADFLRFTVTIITFFHYPYFCLLSGKLMHSGILDPFTNILFPSSIYRKAKESRLFIPEASLVDQLWNIMKCRVFVVESL